jgi:hypothetical protein
MPTLADLAPNEMADKQIAVFVHDHRSGQEVYTAILPMREELPSMTIGGSEPVEGHPEQWAIFQKYIAMLHIPFDEFDDQDHLTCHSESVSYVRLLDPKDF